MNTRKRGYLYIVFLLSYVIMTSITYGYVQRDLECFVEHSAGVCKVVALFAGVVWPAYWTLHTGTLMFEPEKGDE